MSPNHPPLLAIVSYRDHDPRKKPSDEWIAEAQRRGEAFDAFSRFAKQVVETEGQGVSLDAIFDKWHEEACRSDNLARIRATVEDYENGDRGRPAQKVITEFRAEREAGKK